MSDHEKYEPGRAAGARIEKDREEWTLVLVRDLRHPPAMVWEALTDPEQLSEWAPFDADRSLASVGPVKLTTIGAPAPHATTETRVTRADVPRALEYRWGGGDVRWELEPLGARGTRLTLWTNINRAWIAAGAAGWHICFDVLDRLLAHEPIGRRVGPELMKDAGWQRLAAEYAKQLRVEMPGRK
ncbi:MAG TPA: SRPBCC domain-containing protein [Thermoanaerobaculia bacterium]|jgi:uncharacterized protein YndB with AHSA1/START domain